jgi:hypothetical protein
MAIEPDSKAARIKDLLRQCDGFDGDSVSQAREQALNYYFQRERGDEVVGRSTFVSGDVSAMVEATLAQMVEAFSSDRICDFDPLGPEDEDQAQLESDAVQHFVMGSENGLLEMMMAIKEALLMRNAAVWVDAEEKTERIVSRKSSVSIEALAELKSLPDVVNVEYDEENQKATLVYEKTSKQFKLCSIPLTNFVYHSRWHTPIIDGIPVCAVRHITTRAELVSMGIDKKKVDNLTEYNADLVTEEQARKPRDSQYNASIAYDKSQELVEWYTVFVRQEASNGIDEQRKILFSYRDTVILKDEPCSFINVATGVVIVNPHQFIGISLFDKLKQNQDMRTQLRRALGDNLNATTKNRIAGLDGVVNIDDATDPRVNNMIRVKSTVPDVRAALMALQVPDTSANILANLESTARERSEMGGAALDLQTSQVQIGGDRMGSQGLDRAYSVAEQLTASMMKTIGVTLIRSVFLLAHKVLREYFDEPLPIKRNGKWANVIPSEWPERKSVTIKPGMSPGERTRRASALAQFLDAQMMLSDKGMDEVLVDVNGFNKALLDWARLSEIQNPEQYLIDPESERAQVAMENKRKKAQQEKNEKAALMKQAFGMEQLRTALGKYQTDVEMQFKYFSETLKAEIEEAKIVGKATNDLLMQQREGRANANRSSNEANAGKTASGNDEARDVDGPATS